MDSAGSETIVRMIKRVIVITMIVSFSVAAIGGIIVLLGDIWSETAGQVLGTTALTGVISVAVFCGATLIGKSVQWFGFLTVAVSVCTLALLLVMIWSNFEIEPFDYRWIPTASILTATCAVSSLILLLVRHNSMLVRISLAVTLGLLALGSALTFVMIWYEGAYEIDWLVRLVGIVWILAALGTIVVPVSSLLLRQQAAPAPAPGNELSPASVEHINSAARAAGISSDELVSRLLGPVGPVDPTGSTGSTGPNNQLDHTGPASPANPTHPAGSNNPHYPSAP